MNDDRDCRAKLKRIEAELILAKAEAAGAGSLLLDVQQDCIRERQRAEAAENALREIAEFASPLHEAGAIARAALEAKP
jgi:hypothetical protein